MRISDWSSDVCSSDLFPEPGGSAADRKQVLEVLIARLGRDQVLHPSPVADHRPEVANRWVPLDEPAGRSRFPKGLERPFWLLDEPLALTLRAPRPFYGAPLRIVRGPEPTEDGSYEERRVGKEGGRTG